MLLHKIILVMADQAGIIRYKHVSDPALHKEIEERVLEWAHEFAAIPLDNPIFDGHFNDPMNPTEEEILHFARGYLTGRLYDLIEYEPSEVYVELNGEIQVPPGEDPYEFMNRLEQWLESQDAYFGGGYRAYHIEEGYILEDGSYQPFQFTQGQE